MGRYFIEISYNGANYSGWQSQTNAPSVQETLQTTARKVFKQEIEIVGSSRTDAGVHALRQIAQLDFEPSEELTQCVFRWNMALPDDIAVRQIREVKSDTQCRFDAIYRSYQYIITRKKDPFYEGRSLFWYGALDLDSMEKCCQMILDAHDFQAFSKVHTAVNHFECDIQVANWQTDGHLLLFNIKANRFLRGMVRALVGTMMEVGKGRKNLEDFAAILNGKDRKKAGENAPACGLFLVEVGYPETVFV
ncbi:MAG TPA: tRNA pseudouridine(38-40) synthase TruA [Catalimonadaceae bacterium]|nr:tRNA pseudouridine(38-40) synthase TruA [Catalimonadaceae bacterium]